MADIGPITPVADQIQVPPPNQGLNAYSTLLGIQRQKQELQIGQQTLAEGQATAQQAQQRNQELQALRQFSMKAAHDPQYQNSDGSLNVQKFQADAMSVAPTYGQQYIGQATTNANSAVENRKALLGLANDQRQTLGGYFGSVAAKPGATKEDLLEAAEQARGVSDDPAYQKALDRMLMSFPSVDHMPTDQASATIRQAARGIAMGTSAANASASNPDVSNFTTPSGNIGYQQKNPQSPIGVGQIGPTVGQGLAPQVATFPSGQLGIIKGGGPGGGGGAAPAPATGGGLPAMARPGANAPRADQENYQSRIKQLGDEYQQVSSAASDPMNGVQATRYRNQRVLDLAPQAATGPGLKALNVVASRLPGNTGDTYQDIEHYTAQNSAALAKLMGVPNTNLGQETAAAAAGNVERNPGALMEITRANDALNTAFDLYNRGYAKVTNNGSDLSRAAAYKQAFGQTLDMNAIRWADAHRRGDQQEISSLTQKLGPDGIKAVQQKLRTLKSLAENGNPS